MYIPGLIGFGQAFTTLNWKYGTVPQAELGGRKIVINAGKALGGGSISTSPHYNITVTFLMLFYISQ